MGNDELWRWWWQRSRARIAGAQLRDDSLSFIADCRYKGGFVVKVPLGNERPKRCLVDGRPAQCHLERRFGKNWALLPLGPGKHKVAVEFHRPVRGRALHR